DDCTTYCYGVHCCPPAFKCAASPSCKQT
uniref:Conotoxin Cal6.43b n=1 Tax=Californiconus californicus TaxID=1736779 RepID=O163B_CONCL|nr:RecName: Full=Conotoxin Cal6.43b; AltName: Full=Conotoxin Cal6.5a [Californiconus californicus]